VGGMNRQRHPWRASSHEDYLARLAATRLRRELAEYERRCTAPRLDPLSLAEQKAARR